jgi:hypothetical protein
VRACARLYKDAHSRTVAHRAVDMSADLASTIAECLALHAESLDKFGTDQPELHDSIPKELQDKMRQARANVSATLTGCDPAQHVLHLQALCRGLRLVMKRLKPC